MRRGAIPYLLPALLLIIVGCNNPTGGGGGGSEPAGDGDNTVAVTGVSLDPESATVAVGDQVTLSATVEPENATESTVSWSSDDESIATVDDNGTVTGVSPGTVVVTVETTDGGLTAESTITITPVGDGSEETDAVAVTGVTVSPTSAALIIGGTTDLSATVSPANATTKSVSWSSSDTGVATVDGSGAVTAVAAGSATITVTTDDGGFTAEAAITISGGISVTIDFAAPENPAIISDAPTSSVTQGTEISVTVDGSYSSATWYLNGATGSPALTGDTNGASVDTSGLAGDNTVSVVVSDGTNLFSGQFSFTVEN